MSFRQFLERKYLEWQQQEGGRKTVFLFAEWLGFSQSTISGWWNEARTPQGDNILKQIIIDREKGMTLVWR